MVAGNSTFGRVSAPAWARPRVTPCRQAEVLDNARQWLTEQSLESTPERSNLVLASHRLRRWFNCWNYFWALWIGSPTRTTTPRRICQIRGNFWRAFHRKGYIDTRACSHSRVYNSPISLNSVFQKEQSYGALVLTRLPMSSVEY